MPQPNFTVSQPVSQGTADVTIGGTDRDGVEWTETFVATRDVPPGVLFDLADLISKPDSTDQQQAIYSIAAVNRFMNDVLIDDDNRRRWHDLMGDRKKMLPAETAVGIVQYLAEQLTGRPTGPASTSPAS
jgi:hypothetical protein